MYRNLFSGFTYQIEDRDASSEVFAVKFHVVVFWVMTPCSVVVLYQRFGGLCRLHLQVEVMESAWTYATAS